MASAVLRNSKGNWKVHMKEALVSLASIRCVMCGRLAGQLVDKTFVRERRTRAPTTIGKYARCGECGGSLLVEPDEPVTMATASLIIGGTEHLTDSLAPPADDRG
jgi:hypothetical protein